MQECLQHGALTWLLWSHVGIGAFHPLTFNFGVTGHIVVEAVEPHSAIISCEGPLTNHLSKANSRCIHEGENNRCARIYAESNDDDVTFIDCHLNNSHHTVLARMSA